MAEHLSHAANPDGPPIEGEIPPALRVIEALEQGHDNPELQNISNRNVIPDAARAMARDSSRQMEPPVIRIQLERQKPAPATPPPVRSKEDRQTTVQRAPSARRSDI